MDLRPWIPVALSVPLVVMVLLELSPRYRRTTTVSFAGLVALPLSERLLPSVSRRLSRRNLFAAVGGLVGVLVVLVVTALASAAPWFDIVRDLFFTFPFVGFALGFALAAFRYVPTSGPRGHPSTRRPTPTLRDYITPAWIVAAALVSGVGVIATVVFLSISAASPTPATSTTLVTITVALAALTAATLAAAILFSRRIPSSPQPATDALGLAWDDALRAQALRDLWTAPVMLGSTATLAAFSLHTEVGSVITPGWFSPVVVILLFAGQPGKRFQRRLWPDTDIFTPDPPLEPEISAMLGDHQNRTPNDTTPDGTAPR